jgi:hypothetical protein
LSALWQAAHFLNTCSPLVGSATEKIDRLFGGRRRLRLPEHHALDRIAHLLGPLAMEHFARDDRRAERDDAGEQDPAGDGVVMVVA